MNSERTHLQMYKHLYVLHTNMNTWPHNLIMFALYIQAMG